ncbi:unnamed protein product [Rotaria sp. Silwood1]|nr:unnamed protein product [Rotaria sp. Silwood1]CAF1266652.1 unnamed protein product [Rotaria sp. Silwood1]
MSSFDENLVASVNNATIQLNRYLPLLIYISGIIGNLLNIIVLQRPTLRSNPCALLFLFSSFSSLITIISGLTTRLTAGWTIDLSETIGWLCKVRIFILFVSRTMVVWLLVFAAIDRWLSASIHTRRRNLSTLKNAQRSIIVVTFFSLLLNCPLVYCYEANLIGTPAKCFGYSTACRLYTDLSFTCGIIIIPSLLMVLFGLLTINNIHQLRKRVNIRNTSIINPNTSINLYVQQQKKRTNRSLFRMLCVQVLFLIVSCTPYVIYRLYATCTPAISSKSALQIAIEGLLFNLCTNLTYIAAAMPFYIYTLFGGTVFRNELLYVAKFIYQKFRCT